MTIYLDSNYIIHFINDGTMTAIETDAFDGQADAFIEGYRYVPEGEVWTRSDGAQFQGLMIAPAKNYLSILADVAIGVDTIAKGDDGDSAYQIAVNNGYVGTEAQWLASLVGAKGDTGDTGATGNGVASVTLQSTVSTAKTYR